MIRTKVTIEQKRTKLEFTALDYFKIVIHIRLEKLIIFEGRNLNVGTQTKTDTNTN